MVKHPRVAIVADSSSCLPRDIQEASGITIVSHQLIADGKVYRDRIDLEPPEFYRLLQSKGVVTTTSAPSPQAFLEAFQTATSETQEVICITVSPRFSNTTYDSAHIAARMAQEQQPNLKIRIIDSQAAALPTAELIPSRRADIRSSNSIDQLPEEGSAL